MPGTNFFTSLYRANIERLQTQLPHARDAAERDRLRHAVADLEVDLLIMQCLGLDQQRQALRTRQAALQVELHHLRACLGQTV